MTRRKFIKGTGAGAVGAAVLPKSDAEARQGRPKRKTGKRKVLTDTAPKPVGPYSQAIIAGNTIYVAGQGPGNPKTGRIEATSFEDQAVQTFENVKAILSAAGASLSNVVRVNVYLANLNDFAKMNEIYRKYFAEDYPARTTVGTGLLGGMQIEVDCIAVL